jgi:hypothetical protein
MVIVNSDSNCTLVSLDDEYCAIKRVFLEAATAVADPLSIAVDEPERDIPNQKEESERQLYLRATQHLHLSSSLREANDQLLQSPVVHYSQHSKQHYLYVGQGEIAHAVPSQCQVLLSTKATTCHIIAVRSSYVARNARKDSADTAMTMPPLVSMTHLDAPVYDHCLREIIERHKRHHHHHHHLADSTSTTTANNDKIQMDIHIVGGFDDAQGSSQALCDWLLRSLADLAETEQHSIHMVVRTCAVCRWNTKNDGCPMARGLAIQTDTGQVTRASCQEEGPASALRAARLWSLSSSSCRSHHRVLSVIHTQHSSFFTIEPFEFYTFDDNDKEVSAIDHLLALPDDLLLQLCSTSPDQEEDDFCEALRASLVVVRTVSCTDLFGPQCDQCLYYQRVVVVVVDNNDDDTTSIDSTTGKEEATNLWRPVVQ